MFISENDVFYYVIHIIYFRIMKSIIEAGTVSVAAKRIIGALK